MNPNPLEESLKTQAKKAFFEGLKKDLQETPPKTDHIREIINELIEALYKFVPSKKTLHEQIKKDIYQETISLETMPLIVYGLINWIEKFQCPMDDKVTKKWREEFVKTQDCSTCIVTFLQEYYEHSEKVYHDVWEARQRLVSGENIIPPEHRPQIEGTNGIPRNMKTGKDPK